MKEIPVRIPCVAFALDNPSSLVIPVDQPFATPLLRAQNRPGAPLHGEQRDLKCAAPAQACASAQLPVLFRHDGRWWLGMPRMVQVARKASGFSRNADSAHANGATPAS